MYDTQGTHNVSKQKLTKVKNANGTLAWEDESVVIMNHHRVNGGGGGDREPQSHPSAFIHSGSPYNSLQRRSRSPRKNSLNPLESVVCSNRSPSPSPTMKRKHMIGLPQKPVAIDNTSLVMPNTYKVN